MCMTLTTYDQNTYRQPFEDDFLGARIHIGIRSPYLAKKAIENSEWLIYEVIKLGGRVCVFTEEPWYVRSKFKLNPDEEADKKVFLECVQLLVDMGVHVTLVPKIHEKIIVIDYRILWKGSINVLSNDPTKKTETVERETDLFKATNAFYRFNFDACVTCQHIEWSKIRGALSISRQSIEDIERQVDVNEVDSSHATFQGRSFAKAIQDIDAEPVHRWISALRELHKLSIRQLGNKTGIDRKRLSDIEGGLIVPSIKVIVAIFEVFGYSLMLVPTQTVPLVRKIAKGYNKSELSKIIQNLESNNPEQSKNPEQKN